MGSCVSVHRDPDSAMRLRLSFGSKNGKEFIPETVNASDRTGAEVPEVPAKSHWSRPGSKEEAFFDSQPWLDSDVEDDFVSVNGDFTPSRGNTPVHPSFSVGKPRPNDSLMVEGTLDSVPSPSSPEKKKRLSDLFKESLRADQYVDQDNTAGVENVVPANFETRATNVVLQYPKSTNGTPYLPGVNSRGSSERTPNGLFEADDNTAKSAQCCLPRLLSSRSFNERRKRMSPARNLGS
ncbi:hypothetical protein F511_25520 [Dorcoceras hygrometricum]|uniref:Uncharacterized protein n=1 Tax=Dorcoceras hygrometricum TaxID=472368 RepID=A0A2Z7AM24_9LAMI|nr:hypothetical protein F511_25520 [Dorcoceras hygrometricum]